MRRSRLRLLIGGAAVGLLGPLLVPLGAEARPYVGGGDLTSANCGGQTAAAAPGVGGVCFDIPAGKRFAQITITDATGKPTTGDYYFRDAAASIEGSNGMLCGNRTVPVPPTAVRITVYVTTSNQVQACGLMATPGTTGDVSVKFLDDYAFEPVVPGTSGAGTPNITPVANVPYRVVSGWPHPGGTDMEFATLNHGGVPREFALAGSYQNGLHIIDITNPQAPVEVSVYDCRIYQADIQVITRGERTYVAYSVDDYSRTDVESRCFKDVGYVLGTDRYGTFFIDVTDPAAPRAVSFAPFVTGSHNTSIHPGGRYLYSSNADLPGVGTVEIFDLADITKPAMTTSFLLPGSLPAHDVTFSADGSRAYVAALNATHILDTSNPAEPKVVGRVADPAINIHHQADPVTLTDPVLGTRTFMLVTDEFAGAEGNAVCPGGGLHVYDVTGPLEAAPVKVGFYYLPSTSTTRQRTRCTAHVMRAHPEQKLLTIAWYDAGVHVLDLSGLFGPSAGTSLTGAVGKGIQQKGWYAFDKTDVWSVKSPGHFEADGSFYMFANDQLRGFDVYRFNGSAPGAGGTGGAGAGGGGEWLSPAEAARLLGKPGASGPFNPACVLVG